MLSVFICEDNRKFRHELNKIVQDYLSNSDHNMELVMSTDNPSKLLKIIEERKPSGLYFLDIDLGGGDNGVQWANKIRKIDTRGYIAFITSHPNYLPLTFRYKVEALDYIEKTLGLAEVFERVKSCIEDAYSKHVSHSDDSSFVFTDQSGRRISCLFDDILCFKTDARGSNLIIIHTKKRVFKARSSLRKILPELPFGQFLQCHQSNIVSLKNLPDSALHLLNDGKDAVFLSDGATCKVASRNRASMARLLDSRPVRNNE